MSRDEKKRAEKEIDELCDQEPKAHLARCIARHVSNLIAKKTKENTTKRRKRSTPAEIVIHPPEADDRKVLMLGICGDIADFYRQENRDMSSDARQYGTAAFWKRSTHFRHLRKSLGIKGRVCAVLTPKDRRWIDNADIAGRLREAFHSFHEFKADLLRIEDDLKADGISCRWSPQLVWEKVYEELMYPAITPLTFRLASYKWFKERAALRRMGAR